MINNKGKRIGIGILTAILTIMFLYFNPAVQAAETEAKSAFADLSPTTPDISYITYLSAKGIITGFPDGSFKPQEGLTRAQAAVVIAKAAQLSLDPTAASPFKDLSNEHWARPYIAAAVKAGYISGFPDGSFKPDQPLSRAQGISLLLRLSKQPQDASLPVLKDVNNQYWAASAIATGLASGMVGLSADGQNYLPDTPFSRINMAHALGILLTEDPDLSGCSLPGKLKAGQGKITIIKAGSQSEEELKTETTVNQGDTIITSSGASAELDYPDGSSMLIKENSRVNIKEAKGRKYVQTSGQEGIAVDWLNLDMKQGTMFAALATKHESTESTESSSTTQNTQTISMKYETIASLDGEEFIAAAQQKNQASPWYQTSKAKKVKVKVDMPWGVAAIRGTFILISIDSNGHANVSCLNGTAEVSNAGQTVPLGQNQSTTVGAPESPPGNPAVMSATAVQQFNQVQQWVVNTAIQMDVNQEAAPAPIVQMIVETPDQPVTGTTQTEQTQTTLDVVLNALRSSGIQITEQVKQEITQQLQALPQEQTQTVTEVLETSATNQSSSSQGSSSSVLYIDYSSPGTYGPSTSAETQTIAENVIVSSEDVTLQNMIITGDLTLAAGIGEGSVTLNNVTVQGNTDILGGGSNSIHIVDSELYTVTVDKETNTVRIVATGNSSLGALTLDSGAILEESGLSGTGFSDVTTGTSLPDGATIVLTGNFAAVNINSPGLIIQVASGSIDQMNIASTAGGTALTLASGASVSSLQINAAAQITGAGTIKTATINASDVVMEQTPSTWVLGPGVASVSIAGQEVSESGQVSINTMTGTAVIKGTAKYGQTLTADITNLINAGTPTYQWNRDGAAIGQETGSSYTLAETDIGTAITVTVTADGLAGTGSITSAATETIAKADGPAAPADSITGTFPVTADSINLAGIAAASEIGLEAAVAIDGSTYGDYVNLTVYENGNATLSELNGVTTATKVKIRIKATTTTFAGIDREITVTANDQTDADISGSFEDINFRQAVWKWLGNTVDPSDRSDGSDRSDPSTGTFTKKDLIDRMGEKGYTLDVSYDGISSLAGLENFKGTGIISFSCKDNKLSSLPDLPGSLEYLDCSGNQLSSLPALPSSLIDLYCGDNQLTSLPVLAVSPGILIDLFCENNQLTGLPDLPGSLEYFDCAYNQLTSLPKLPSEMTEIDCSYNFLNVFFTGSVETTLDNCTTTSYKYITPQYRYSYIGTDIFLSAKTTNQSTNGAIKLQESTDGMLWVNSIDEGMTGKFTFSSSDKSVATVDSNGVITAVASGSCTIYAKYGDVDSNFTKATILVSVSM